MLALLAANSYLGIEDANLLHIYWFAGAFGILAVCLLVWRFVELLMAARRKKKASWNTFRQLAKTRGLKPVQIEVLMLVARQGSVKRPPKVLGSIQLFDKTVQKAQENYEFSEKQLMLIDSIRKKLVASKVKWTPQTSVERRQLGRTNCSWNARIVLVAKEVVDREMLKTTGDDDERLQVAVAELIGPNSDEELTESKVQIRDISAGGAALLASKAFGGAAGDFSLLCGESQRIPFVLDNLCGEIRSIEEDVERGCLVLHFRFLTLEPELRKAIIHYIYEKRESKAAKMNAEKTPQSVAGSS